MLIGSRRTLLRRAPLVASVSAEVTQFLARATGMNGTHVSAFTALIDGLVADAVWSSLDALWIVATDTEAHAKMNLKSSSYSILETGTMPWTADVGYSGTGSDGSNYLSSGFNPSTAGGNFVQNSGHLSAWVVSALDTNLGMMGARDTSAALESLVMAKTSGNSVFRANESSAFSGISVANAATTGHYIASRTGSAVIAGYKNGSQTVTGTTTSGSLINLTLGLGGRNSNGTILSEEGVFSAFSIGAGLDATKALALYTRIATYRTAVGL